TAIAPVFKANHIRYLKWILSVARRLPPYVVELSPHTEPDIPTSVVLAMPIGSMLARPPLIRPRPLPAVWRRRVEEFFEWDPDTELLIHKNDCRSPFGRSLQDHPEHHNSGLVIGQQQPVFQNRTSLAEVIARIPLTDALGGPTIASASIKEVRAYLSPPPAATTGTSTQWRQFWTQNIPHKARSLWWRLLLRKLPVAKYRHEVWGHDSPLCHECGLEETIEHAYVGCLTKGFAWRDFLALYTDVRVWRDADIFSLVTFDPIDFNILPSINITKAQVVACGLLGIKASIDTYYLTERSLRTDAIFNIMASHAAIVLKENATAKKATK
ncbi:hypothetical protein BGZ99_001438, partial [Dissophora globulifera]